MANRIFLTLVLVAVGLVGTMGWSTHHLLIAGAPTLASQRWPGLDCVLLPLAGDVLPHAASYLFLLAIAAGTTSGLATLVRQRRQTDGLLRRCLASSVPQRPDLHALARELDLEGRLDVAQIAAPLAFCYGYVRPRVLVSTELLQLLSRDELAALLLHEREHMRQRDPLKVAFGKLLISALFFIPLVRALYERYLVEKELAADRAAIRAQGSTESLGAALVQLIDHRGRLLPAPGVGVTDALEARIDALLGDTVPLGLPLSFARAASSLVILLLAALPLVSAPLPAPSIVASHHNIVAQCHLDYSAPS